MQDQLGRRGLDRRVRHPDRKLARVGEGRGRIPQPSGESRRVHEPDRFAREEGGRDRARQCRIGDAPTGRRLVG